jgi:hypothetical protein
MRIEENEYDEQLEMGKKVEREHAPTYQRLVAYVRERRQLPPAEWLYASIARDHLNLNNPVDPGNPRYYTILEDAGL